jgi:hypothetical protein
VYAKTGEKEEESRAIKRTSESRTDPMDLHKDNEERVLDPHLSPELNPWNFRKIKKVLHRHLSPELNPWNFRKIKKVLHRHLSP